MLKIVRNRPHAAFGRTFTSIRTTLAMSTTTTTTTTKATKMSLAILDDYPNIAPKHFQNIPNLHKIESFPQTLDPSTPAGLEALVQRLHPYEIISSMRERTPFPAELQRRLPKLKLLLNSSLRNNSIDLQVARELGIVVTGTRGERRRRRRQSSSSQTDVDDEEEEDLPPPAGHSAVIQHAWALLLSLCGRIPQDDRLLKTDPHVWQSGVNISLAGKTIGIVGLGKLGTAMARIAVVGFGMRVLAWSENLTQEKADAAAEGAGLEKGVFKAVGKEEMFKRSDVVSLHLVLSERSRGVVGERELGWMKKRAVLVNTSRGPLVDEGALVRVLQEGRIGGVALDVFDQEPLPADSVWRGADGFESAVVLSPHMGYVNGGTMNRWYEEQAENVERWLNGEEVLNRMN